MNAVQLVVGALLTAFLLVGCAQPTTPPTTPEPTPPSDGRFVVTVTDAAADLGAVSSIEMTFDEVAVHSQTEGWTTLSTRSTTVDLLDLRADARHVLLADTELEEGEYDQLRFDVTSVFVTDASGRHEAVMPDDELVMNAQTSVNAESTSSASIDIIADSSLHTAADGRYVFAPVIQVETRSNAQVNAQNAQNVAITGGIVQTNERIGMDVAGNLVIGGSLPPYLNITSTGRIIGYQDAPIGLNLTGMLDVNT